MHTFTSLIDVLVVFTVTVNVALLSQPAALVKPVLVCVPAALNVKPFQLYGNALGQIAILLLELVTAFTVTVNVALLSQPAALVKPVLVCVPAALKVKPFQLYGNALGQIAMLLLELVTAFTVTVNVALLSQPPAFVKPVLVCVPAALNVKPFQLYGNALGQIAMLLFDVVGVQLEIMVKLTMAVAVPPQLCAVTV